MFDIYYRLTEKGNQELARYRASHTGNPSQMEMERIFYLSILHKAPRALSAEEVTQCVKQSKTLAPLTIMGRKTPIMISKRRSGFPAVELEHVVGYMKRLEQEGFVVGIGLAH